jgi:hypothetical protein
MTDLDSISRMGVSARWPSRKTVVQWLEKAIPHSIALAQAYNARTDTENTLNLPPNSTYVRVGAQLRSSAEVLALTGQRWEREMSDAVGFQVFCDQLYFFWHVNFRKLFPEHPQPLRMLSWGAMTETMAMAFILGRIQEGIYQGYLTYAALNRTYQLQISYADKHRRVHAFMLRLFSLWRGDMSHDWPPYAYDEPIYEGILERWDNPDPDALTPWLLAACDRHTHESKQDGKAVFYDCSAFPRTPLEILFLFQLRELIGLSSPVLEHPLMEMPFDRLPEPQAAYVPDELVQGTLARVREDWPQFDETVALEVLRST